MSDNKNFTTSGGYNVVLKGFITGKDKRYIKDAFLEGAKFDADGKFKVDPDKMHVAEDRTIETIVISVDGKGVDKTKTILDQVLALPSTDCSEIVAEINEISEGKKKG